MSLRRCRCLARHISAHPAAMDDDSDATVTSDSLPLVEDDAEQPDHLHGRLEDALPLFVVGTALPTRPMSVQVFEPRYKTMIERVLRSRQFSDDPMGTRQDRQRTFGMVAPHKDGSFSDTGTFMRITAAQPHPETPDRFVIETVGVGVFQVIESWFDEGGYAVARVKGLPDQSDSASESQGLDELAMSVREQFQHFCEELLSEAGQAVPGAVLYTAQKLRDGGEAPSDPAEVSWWITDMLPAPAFHMRFLKERSIRQRLGLLQELMVEMLQQIDAKRQDKDQDMAKDPSGGKPPLDDDEEDIN